MASTEILGDFIDNTSFSVVQIGVNKPFV